LISLILSPVSDRRIAPSPPYQPITSWQGRILASFLIVLIFYRSDEIPVYINDTLNFLACNFGSLRRKIGGFARRRCLSICLFVCLVLCSLFCRTMRPTKGVSYVLSLVKNFPSVINFSRSRFAAPSPVSHVFSAREIYDCGGGLLMASINAHLAIGRFFVSFFYNFS